MDECNLVGWICERMDGWMDGWMTDRSMAVSFNV